MSSGCYYVCARRSRPKGDPTYAESEVRLGAGGCGFHPGQDAGEGLFGHGEVDGAIAEVGVDDDVAGVGDQRLVAHRAAGGDAFEAAAVHDQLRPPGEAEDPKPLQVVTHVTGQTEGPATAVVLLGQLEAAVERAAVPGQPATTAREESDQQHGGSKTDPDDIEDCTHTLPTPFPVPSVRYRPGHCRRTVLSVTMFDYGRWVQDVCSAARTRASASRTSSASASAMPAASACSRSRRASSRSMSCPISAFSARIETRSFATEMNPSGAAATKNSPSVVRTWTVPPWSRPSSGAWPGRIPTSPSVVRAITNEAWPCH